MFESVTGSRAGSVGTLASRLGWVSHLRAIVLPALAGALIAASPALAQSGWVYTADEKGNTISVVDLGREKATSVKIPISPHNVQVSDDGQLLFAVGIATGHGASHGKAEPGQLLVFDAQSIASGPKANIPVGPHPAHVVVDRQGRAAYVSDSADNAVHVVDLAGGAVSRKIATGRYPHGLRLSPDGRELYVANMKDGTVSVVDVSAGREVERVAVGRSPVQVGFTPDGTRAYVSLNGENAVSIVDTSTRKVIGKVPVGRSPVQVFATPDGKLVYVANQGTEQNPDDSVTAIDVSAGKPVATLTTGKGAHGVAVSTRGDRVFVSNIVANSVSVIDVASQRVVGNIPVGKGPNGITYRE